MKWRKSVKIWAFFLIIAERISKSWETSDVYGFKISFKIWSLSTHLKENDDENTWAISIFHYRFENRITIILFRDLKFTNDVWKEGIQKLRYCVSPLLRFFYYLLGLFFSVQVSLFDRKGFIVFQNVLLSIIFFTSRLL